MSQKTLCSAGVPREVLAGALQAGYEDVYSPPRSRVLDKHGPEGDGCSGKHLEMFAWCRALLRTNKSLVHLRLLSETGDNSTPKASTDHCRNLGKRCVGGLSPRVRASAGAQTKARLKRGQGEGSSQRLPWTI